jgi:monothiol glutaredoxin
MQSLFLRSATRTLPATFSAHRLGSLRFLTQEVRAKIDGAVKAKPLVLFMKGTPELPQCGFSRAVVQILDLHGVAPEKMQSYDVLVDPELRSSIKEYSYVFLVQDFKAV